MIAVLLSKKTHDQALLNRYQTMLSSLHEGVILLNNQGDVVECNQSAADLLELPYDVLKNMNTFESDWHAIKADGTPYLPEELPINMSLHSGQKINGAIIGLQFSDRIKWLTVNTRRIKIPELSQGQGGLITFTDSTEVFNANKLLTESEQRYKTVSEMTSDFIYFVQVNSLDNHQLVWTSGSLHSILEIPLSTDFHLPKDYVAHVHPKDRSSFIAAMRPLFYNKKANNIHRVITPLGIKWIECHLSPIYSDTEKRVTHLLGSIKDITAQKEAEIKLHELSQEIINTQENERNILARELHDNVGQGAPSILLHLKNIQKIHSDNETQKIIAIAEAELRQMNDSIRRIHEWLEPKSLNILGLKAAVEELVVSMCEQTTIKPHVSVVDLDHIKHTDHHIHIYRIVQESVRNIIKHSHATAVEVSTITRNHQLVLSIKDNGQGFASTHSQNYDHFGLSIMNERAELIGSQLEIDSIENQGTRVSLSIPY